MRLVRARRFESAVVTQGSVRAQDASAMSDPFLIYGATGYTGRLMASDAMRVGLRPILAGRDPGKLEALAAATGLECRTAALADADALDRALADVAVVVHAAGPFAATARPMLDACLRTGTHYLDISGEVPAIESLARSDAAARARRIMVMPGVGFDVVPSDCLAAHVTRRLPSATSLVLGIAGLTLATRGSVKTLVEYAGDVAVRRGGALTALPPGALQREFDYGAGPRASVAVSWGDVASAYYTTGVPNVDVCFEATPALRSILAANRYLGPLLRSPPSQVLMKAAADLIPDGPVDAERAAARTTIVARAEDGHGRRAEARLHAPEAYTLTAATAPAVARRVLAGDLEPGFQTPARVYGPDFALAFAGITREDVA